ncbi:lipase family protein [Pectobacterium polonicum]|uniref:Lipase family protein n=1 Tax=Pectobacterium polonicum TaxID=2485124 RepID=A0AAE9NPM8_9GAMM|nr:lipase family protein [Pectobacterium polonicum]UVO08865.1 lipase family protein [Pectobacterium polonicum]GKW26305.1 triacylglycerol lipase [Pectobacterium carotovorum subsp. carotovorum]
MFHVPTFKQKPLALLLAISIGMMAPFTFAETKTPGTLVEKTTLDTKHGLMEAGEQYRIKYSSKSGVDGESLREDTGAVFIPKGEAPKEGWPVVVWTHGTIGVGTSCAPSLNPRSARDSQYLNTWLSLGFAIVAPDYAGLGSAGLHHYLNSRGEAWSVLDSVKASLTTFPLQNKLTIVGQSQGAHAAFASTGYQPDYAPNLNIASTVLTGTPYFDDKTSAKKIFDVDVKGGDPKIPYVMYIYLSATDMKPGFKVEDYFEPEAAKLVEDARKMCIGELTQKVMEEGLNAKNSLKSDIYKLLDDQMVHFRYNTLHVTPPVFIGIGTNDINVPTKMQVHFAEDVVSAGTSADVHEYKGMDHSETVNVSLRNSVPFVLGK